MNQQIGVGIGYAGYSVPTVEDVFSLAKKLNDAIKAMEGQGWSFDVVAGDYVSVKATKTQNGPGA